MNAELFTALDLLEEKNGISKEYMLGKIEEALANACRKEVGATAQIRVHLDPVKNDMKVFQQRTVVEDGTVEDERCQISLSDAKALSRRHKLGGVVKPKAEKSAPLVRDGKSCKSPGGSGKNSCSVS